MSNMEQRAGHPSHRWAPWWVYVVTIVIVSQVRQMAIGNDVAGWVHVVTAIPVAITAFVLITVIYRSLTSGR